jgi:hypothetical protein
MGERIFNEVSPSPIFVQRTENFPTEIRYVWEINFRGFYVPGKGASHATVELLVQFAERIYRDLYLDIFGYVGNGRAELSDFNAGVRLDSQNAFTPYPFSRPVETMPYHHFAHPIRAIDLSEADNATSTLNLPSNQG